MSERASDLETIPTPVGDLYKQGTVSTIPEVAVAAAVMVVVIMAVALVFILFVTRCHWRHLE